MVVVHALLCGWNDDYKFTPFAFLRFYLHFTIMSLRNDIVCQ